MPNPCPSNPASHYSDPQPAIQEWLAGVCQRQAQEAVNQWYQEFGRLEKITVLLLALELATQEQTNSLDYAASQADRSRLDPRQLNLRGSSLEEWGRFRASCSGIDVGHLAPIRETFCRV